MQTQRQVDERTLEVLKQARSKDLAGDIARRASISALEARLASTQPESAGSVLQGDMSADDVALMARQVGYPISHPEWRKATEEFAALLAAAILRASPAKPKAPASDDPHRDHWVAIAETSQRIAASKECGPAEAASFCAAIERLSSALEKSDERAAAAEPEQDPGFWGRIAARQATRIKRLETTGQQALEALRCVDLQSLVPDYGSGHYSVARLDGPQVKSAITAMEAALAEPGTVVSPESPEVQVRAIASEIIDALNADEQDGGYDLTGGLFGARFSALVRRWAALESAATQSWQQLIALRTAISEIEQGCERRLRKGRDAGDEATLRICRQAMEDLGRPAAAPPKPLSASDIESAIGYRIPQHSMELLLRLMQERDALLDGLRKALPHVVSSHEPVGTELDEMDAAVKAAGETDAAIQEALAQPVQESVPQRWFDAAHVVLKVTRGLHAQGGRHGRLPGVVPPVLEELNDELRDENERRERP